MVPLLLGNVVVAVDCDAVVTTDETLATVVVMDDVPVTLTTPRVLTGIVLVEVVLCGIEVVYNTTVIATTIAKAIASEYTRSDCCMLATREITYDRLI